MLAEHDRACFIGLLISVFTAFGGTRVSANGSIKQATDYFYHDTVKKTPPGFKRKVCKLIIKINISSHLLLLNLSGKT